MSKPIGNSQRFASPKVSVVIPTHNRESDLRRCLESLKSQSFQEFEVLICDDGSTDGTRQVADEYSRYLDIKYDYSDNFGGPARPRNRGIRLARTPYVAFLDSDDWWMPEKLEVSLDYLEKGADVVYHDLLVVSREDGSGGSRRSPTRELKSPAYEDLIVNGNALTNSSVVMRKSLLDAVGGFREDKELIAAEDYEAWVRISKVTEKFVRIPKTLGYYWAGGTANISNPQRVIRSLDAFEALYRDSINELGKSGRIYWINYAKGRSYYRLRKYDMARRNLQQVRWSSAPFAVWIRSLTISLWITACARE